MNLKEFSDDLKDKVFYYFDGSYQNRISFIGIEPKSNNRYAYFYRLLDRIPLRMHIDEFNKNVFHGEKNCLELVKDRLKRELHWVNRRLEEIEGE